MEARQDYIASIKHSRNRTRASTGANSPRRSSFPEGPAITACGPQLSLGCFCALWEEAPPPGSVPCTSHSTGEQVQGGFDLQHPSAHTLGASEVPSSGQLPTSEQGRGEAEPGGIIICSDREPQVLRTQSWLWASPPPAGGCGGLALAGTLPAWYLLRGVGCLPCAWVRWESLPITRPR